MSKDFEIYTFCESRWNYYEKRDKGYFPSKHDSLVFEEASRHFNISLEEVEKSFNKIAKLKADQEVKNMTKKQMVDTFENILRNNKETPWGQELDKKQK